MTTELQDPGSSNYKQLKGKLAINASYDLVA